MAIKTTESFSSLKKWELVLIVVLVSDICIVLVNALLSYIMLGRIDNDFIFIGMVDAMIVPVLTAPFIIYLFSEENRRARETQRLAQQRLNEAEETLRQAHLKNKEVQREFQEMDRTKTAFFSTVSRQLQIPVRAMLHSAKTIKDQVADEAFDLDKEEEPLMADDFKKFHVREKKREAERKALRVIENIQEDVDSLLLRSELLSSRIGNIIDLAAIESGIMQWHEEDLDMRDVFERAAGAADPLLQSKGLRLRKVALSEKLFLKGDRDKLVQAVLNILDYSINRTRKGEISCKLSYEAGKVKCEIEHTGKQMPEDEHNFLFGSSAERKKSAETGLALCVEIVRYHRGDIWVERVEESGDRFVILLPSTEPEIMAVQPSAPYRH